MRNREFLAGQSGLWAEEADTFRTEDVTPERSLELYLTRHHWTDGFHTPAVQRGFLRRDSKRVTRVQSYRLAN